MLISRARIRWYYFPVFAAGLDALARRAYYATMQPSLEVKFVTRCKRCEIQEFSDSRYSLGSTTIVVPSEAIQIDLDCFKAPFTITKNQSDIL